MVAGRAGDRKHRGDMDIYTHRSNAGSPARHARRRKRIYAARPSRRGKRRLRRMTLVAIGIAIAAQAAVAPARAGMPLAEHFAATLAVCAATTGYDRTQARALGPYQLGRSEKAWRECAYHRVLESLMPLTRDPAALRQVIDADKRHTSAIERSEMTRNERWQRNRAALQTALHDEDLVRIEAHAYRQQLLDDAQQAIDDDLRILHSVIRGFRF